MGETKSEESKMKMRCNLLVSTLHARFLVIFVHRVILHPAHAAPCSCIRFIQRDFFDSNVLVEFLNRIAWRKSPFEQGDRRRVHRFWEFDTQLDIQVAGFVVSLRRHSLAMNNLEFPWYKNDKKDVVSVTGFELTVFYNFPRFNFDEEGMVIEMFDCKLTTCKRCQKVDLNFGDKVVVLSFEALVWFFFDDNYDIPRFCGRRLVTFPSELDGLASFHPFVDMNLEEFLLGKNLLPFAVRTTILRVDDLSRSCAFVAGRLDLLDHWAHLTQSDLDAPSATCVTCPYRAILATLPFTLRTDDVPSQSELCGFSFIEIFEGDVDSMDEIFRFAWALRSTWTTRTSSKEASASAKQLTEKVLIFGKG